MTVSRWGALGSAGLAIVLFFPLAKALFGVEEQESLLRAMSGDVVVLRNTLVFAVTVAVLATLVAWGCAHGERHHDYRGRKLAHLLCLAPLVLPPPVLALAVLTLWGHNGVVTRLFAPQWDVYGLPGLTLAATGSAVPLAYVILRQALDLRDHRLMETSRDLGASSWRVLWTVEWPVIRPAMVVAFLVVFGQAVSNLADPLVLGGGFTVLSTRLFESVTAENDVISAGACAILLVSTGIGAAVVAGLAAGGRRPAHQEGHAVRRPPRGWGWLTVALHLGVGAANVLAVLIVLVEALGGWDLFGMTGRHVMAVLTGSQSAALADTVLAALVSTMVTVSLAWWWGVRMVADTIESRISMGFWQAMPTLVCGLGAWVAVTRWTGPLMEISPWELPVSELMTWFFLLVVMVLSSLPGLTGTIADRASTVPTSLVGSAHALGAGAGAVRREVVFPHVRPVLAAQLPVTLARSLGALGPAALLATPRTPLLPVEMITAAEAGRLSDACAMALVTGVLVAACISLTIKTAAVVVDR